MKARKPSEKFSLGLQARVATTIVATVAQDATAALVETIAARRRQLVKRGTSPEALKLWDKIMREFCARAARGYGDLRFFLWLGECPENPVQRMSLFQEVGIILTEDGLESCLNVGASGSLENGIGYETTCKWSS